MKLEKKIIIFTIIAIGIYSVFLALTDVNLVYDKFSNFKFEYIPLIMIIIFSSWFVLFLRWVLVLKNYHIEIPFKDNLLIFFTGYAFAISPGKSGELIKSVLLKEKFGIKRSITVPLVVAERFYDIVGALIVSFFGMIFLGFDFLPIVIGAATILSLAYVLIYSQSVFNSILKIVSKISFLNKFIEPFKDSRIILKKSTKGNMAIFSILLTVVYRLIESVGVLLVLLAFDIDILHYLALTAIYATSIILGNVSLIPGGVGITEGSLTGLFSLQGIELSIAIVLSISIRFFTLWYAVIVGFISMKLSRTVNLNE